MIERTELITVYKMQKYLISFINYLESGRKYLSSKDKEILFDILLIYGNISDNNVSHELTSLRSKQVTPEILIQIQKKIKHLLELCQDEFTNFTPQTDDERFDIMINEYEYCSLISEYRNILKTLGMHLCNVRYRSKKIEIFAEKSKSDFELIAKQWGFEEPYKYFDYYGECPIPQGRLD